MKILKKRLFASFIDHLIIAIIMALIQYFFPWFFDNMLGAFPILMIYSPIVLRDLIFGNASIGKKMLGIRVYDIRTWKKPSVGLSILRAAASITVVQVIMYRSMRVTGDFIDVFDWERDHLHTMVIDKNVYLRLRNEAEKMKGDFAKNMTDLYNSYLSGIYIKE